MTGTEIQCTRTLVEKLDHAKGLLAKAGGPGATRARPVIPARRVHNNFAAEEIMGIEFMAMKKAAALNRSQLTD